MTTTVSTSDATSQFRGNRSWIGRAVIGTMLGLTIALLVHFRTNFHTVVPGLVYRSGQLDPVTLDQYIQRFHFHTIINLRGAGPQADWYVQERAVARHHHIRFLDLPVDSTSPLQPDELRQLLAVLQEKGGAPILIHCQSGIDRSGSTAVACALLLEKDHGLERAKDQLQWRHGNLPWFRSTKSIRAYLDRYQRWLDQLGLEHSPGHFCQWALTIDHTHS